MKFLKIFLFICVILLCIAIFCLSAQPSSSSNVLSKWLTTELVSLYQAVTGSADAAELTRTVSDIHSIVRKYAHFVLYAVLGLLCALSFSFISPRRSVSAYIFAFLFCVLFAVSDEYHQTFVQGRSGELRDIFIDSFGAFIGIFAVFTVNWLKKRKYRQ